MNKEVFFENCAVGSSPEELSGIHQSHVNIAIYNRDIMALTNEIMVLKEGHIDFRSSGSFKTLLKKLRKALDPNKFELLLADILRLLELFGEVTQTNNFRISLATISTTMCPRFHADNNELRMLCTYHGPGTLWLPDHAVDRNAHLNGRGNASNFADESAAQEVKTGDVALLKGGLYPAASPILHCSPTITSPAEKRVLLTIDANESLNLSR